MSSIKATPTTGRVWLFGDSVTTDALAAGRYMKLPIEDIATHCLEDLRPEFAGRVRAGDVLVAGRDFGIGSSREQSAQVLKQLGVAAVIARSFSGLFYRNAINLGLPLLVCEQLDAVRDAASVSFDLDRCELTLTDTGTVIACKPIPQFLLALLRHGGLMAELQHRLGNRTIPPA